MQTEADMLGAAQKTTSSLQRSRQVMLQQIDNQQNVLAAMDASHEQLAKTTEEYQGQSSVYGNTRQLLKTMKQQGSVDKLILYGGFAMFMLVCLYIIQKRSVYFVPTFVKTGLGKLVPSWARLSSGRDVDQLVKPVKGVFLVHLVHLYTAPQGMPVAHLIQATAAAAQHVCCVSACPHACMLCIGTSQAHKLCLTCVVACKHVLQSLRYLPSQA